MENYKIGKLELPDIIDFILNKYTATEVSREISNWFIPEKSNSGYNNTKKHENIEKNSIETKEDLQIIVQNKTNNDELNINVNVGRLKKDKQANVENSFRVKNLKFNVERNVCAGILASGKECIKKKVMDYGMCTRCGGELKVKGKIQFDEDLGYFYRDIKFTVDDPNGQFSKGQEIRQYSKYSRTFDFNGSQYHHKYYIFTRKDAMKEFRTCTMITSSSPFFKISNLKKISIKKYKIVYEDDP